MGSRADEWRWLAIVAGGFGLAAYIRRRRRRARQVEVEPADELRAKLAQSRFDQSRFDQPRVDQSRVDESGENVESNAVPTEGPETAPDELDERRRDVHERGRKAIDELG